MDREEKARDIRLRAKAERQGMTVTRSRRRDPDAVGYGKYFIHGSDGQLLTLASGITLDEVEAFLVGPAPQAGD